MFPWCSYGFSYVRNHYQNHYRPMASAGWWFTYPSKRYESQLGWLFHSQCVETYTVKCSSHHQSDISNIIKSHETTILQTHGSGGFSDAKAHTGVLLPHLAQYRGRGLRVGTQHLEGPATRCGTAYWPGHSRGTFSKRWSLRCHSTWFSWWFMVK